MNDVASPHVVIIGGGFGGLTAAQSLRRARVRVTLIDRVNFHLFQPLLYQVAMAGLSPADIAVPIRSVLSDATVLLAEITHVDLAARRVHVEGSDSIAYDFLIVATGAETNYFGQKEWAKHALGMKTIDDAIEIRRRVLLAFEAAEREPDADARRRLLTFVIIGGGPTGVEVAGALTELGRFVLAEDFRQVRAEHPRVVLVERGPRLLAGGFDERLAEAARVDLTDLGVDVRLGVRVTGIDDRGVDLEGERLDATTILWTAGVRAKPLPATFGVELDRGGRVKVNPDCSIPGRPEVFVLGDAASFVPEGQDHPLPGVSPVAMQQARFVASLIGRRVEGEIGAAVFHYVDKGLMATIGRSKAVAQSHGLRLRGLLAWLAWLLVHIWYLIGFRNRIVVLFNWAWNYFTYKRGARLITGDRSAERALDLARRAERSDSS